MVMASYCLAVPLIEPTCPLSVAEHPVRVTVPKSAKGRIPPEKGGSTIHSADERWALLLLCVVENVTCWVMLSMVSLKRLFPMYFTSAEIVSPAWTGKFRMRYPNLGYISNHA